MTLSNRWLTAAVLLLCLLPSAYSAWIARDMPYLGGWHDDAIYLVSAKSLASGNGYRIESLPDSPWQTKYPPLFPLYLSMVWRIAPDFPGNLPLATLFCWLLLPVWLALAWRLLRDIGLSETHALILCGVIALNQHTVMFGMIAMSEVTASALWMASAALAIRAVDSPRRAALAGLVGGLAYLTKSATMPLLLAVPVFLALRKQRRGAVLFAACMLPAVIGWNVWMRAHLAPSTDYTSLFYLDYVGYQFYNIPFRDLPVALVKNLDRVFWAIGSMIAGMGESAVDDVLDWAVAINFLGRAIAFVSIAGVIRHARRTGANPYNLFAAGYLSMVLMWHYPPSERFLFPLMPLLLAGFSTQLQSFGEFAARLSRPVRLTTRTVAVALACLWCALIAMRFVEALPRGLDVYRRLRASNLDAYQWIAANTPADARFLAYEDPMLYLYAGRKGYRRIVPTRYFYQGNPDGVRDVVDGLPTFARSHRLQYLLTTPNDWHGELLPNSSIAEFRKEINEIPEATPIFRSTFTTIYKFDWDSNVSARSKAE